jgi:hypothetical protein
MIDAGTWIIGGMILAGEELSTWRKPVYMILCPP